jgi:hypothetical protein
MYVSVIITQYIITIHVLSKSGVWGFEIRACFILDGLPAKAYELHLHKAIRFKMPDTCQSLCHKEWHHPIIYVVRTGCHGLFWDMKLDNTVKPCV